MGGISHSRYAVLNIQLTVKDILLRGHLAPLTQEQVMKLHSILRASSNKVLRVLATEEWPVRASLGDLLQVPKLNLPYPLLRPIH